MAVSAGTGNGIGSAGGDGRVAGSPLRQRVALFVPLGSLGGAKRQPLSGTVCFEGRPIPWGDIEFVPQVMSPGQEFTPGWAEIRDGEFAHSGLGSGIYLLRIRSELVETHQTHVDEEEAGHGPALGRPCQRPAPVIAIKRDARNHFDVRLK